MDAKARLQLVAAGVILFLCTAAFVVNFFVPEYSPPPGLIGFGFAVVTWLFGSAVLDDINKRKNGNGKE